MNSIRLRRASSKNMHAYTITHAIEDRNAWKFHIDYFKRKGNQNPSQARPCLARRQALRNRL